MRKISLCCLSSSQLQLEVVSDGDCYIEVSNSLIPRVQLKAGAGGENLQLEGNMESRLSNVDLGELGCGGEHNKS